MQLVAKLCEDANKLFGTEEENSCTTIILQMLGQLQPLLITLGKLLIDKEAHVADWETGSVVKSISSDKFQSTTKTRETQGRIWYVAIVYDLMFIHEGSQNLNDGALELRCRLATAKKEVVFSSL